MRRQFILPEADGEHLEAHKPQWETVVEPGWRWLLVHGFPVPDGYNVSSVTAAVSISPGYPDAPLDRYIFTRPSPALMGAPSARFPPRRSTENLFSGGRAIARDRILGDLTWTTSPRTSRSSGTGWSANLRRSEGWKRFLE